MTPSKSILAGLVLSAYCGLTGCGSQEQIPQTNCQEAVVTEQVFPAESKRSQYLSDLIAESFPEAKEFVAGIVYDPDFALCSIEWADHKAEQGHSRALAATAGPMSKSDKRCKIYVSRYAFQSPFVETKAELLSALDHEVNHAMTHPDLFLLVPKDALMNAFKGVSNEEINRVVKSPEFECFQIACEESMAYKHQLKNIRSGHFHTRHRFRTNVENRLQEHRDTLTALTYCGEPKVAYLSKIQLMQIDEK